MSEKRAATLQRRAKRKRKKVESATRQRFEDALKIMEVAIREGGVVFDEKTGLVAKVESHLMEAYRAGRLREALREAYRRAGLPGGAR